MVFRKHGKWTLPILVGVALLAPLTPARAQWTIQTVEEGVGGDVSLAYDPSGNPAITYGAGSVKFAHFDGTSWDIEVISVGGGFLSLAYSPQGAPSVTSHRGQPHAGIYFASKNGTTWNSTRLDTNVWPDDQNSLLYGIDGNPAVAYRRYGKSPGLTVARRSSAGVWTKQVVDSGVAGARCNLSMALDPDGNLAIAYSHDADGDGRPDTLKFALQSGSSWVIETVESGTVGYGSQVTLAYDPITGRPSVACGSGQYPTSLGPVFLHKTESDTWERTFVDQTVTRQVRGCSLAYRPDGTAFLAYGADTGDPVEPFSLKVAWRDPEFGTWTIEVVEQPSDKGISSYPSLKIDASGNLGLAYAQPTSSNTNAVKFAHRPMP